MSKEFKYKLPEGLSQPKLSVLVNDSKYKTKSFSSETEQRMQNMRTESRRSVLKGLSLLSAGAIGLTVSLCAFPDYKESPSYQASQKDITENIPTDTSTTTNEATSQNYGKVALVIASIGAIAGGIAYTLFDPTMHGRISQNELDGEPRLPSSQWEPVPGSRGERRRTSPYDL